MPNFTAAKPVKQLLFLGQFCLFLARITTMPSWQKKKSMLSTAYIVFVCVKVNPHMLSYKISHKLIVGLLRIKIDKN